MINTVIFIFIILEAFLVAIAARRVLGVPIGWPRSALIGLLVILGLRANISFVLDYAGLPQNQALAFPSPMALLFMGLAAAWIFALGVAALVVLELAVPTGTLPRISAWLRGWKARRHRAKRYTQVIGIAARHGLGAYIRGHRGSDPHAGHTRVARSLTLALTEAGVTFIKLGQMLSTRTDLIPKEFVVELSALQTRAEPEPWHDIEPAIAAGLARPVSEVFEHIDPVPLASASIAQVHLARLLDGGDVVVKIQRPGARAQVESDTEIILRLARWLNKATPWGHSLGVYRLAEAFTVSLGEELDYRVELDNMRSVGAIMASYDGWKIAVPSAYTDYSTPQLLVMSRLAGTPVGEAAEVLNSLGSDVRRNAAEKLFKAVLHQIMVAGVFHADLHPGNIFVDEHGGLGMLDFGSIGRLDQTTQRSLMMLLHAVDTNNAVAAADALLDLIERPEAFNERRFERDVGLVIMRYRTGFGGAGSTSMFTALITIITGHGVAVPAPIAATFRAMATLEGTLSLISPDFDMVASARADSREILAAEFTKDSLRENLEKQLLMVLPVLQRLPRRIDRITEDLEQGRFSVNIRTVANKTDRGFFTEIVKQLNTALLAGAATLGAILLITSSTGPMLTPTVPFYGFLGFAMLFAAFILALRALVLVFKRNPGPPLE